MRVVAALSGGVDSSVAAALLVEQGHEVIGITLKLAPDRPAQDGSRRCCSADDAADARGVCAALDIPFYVLDAQDPFARNVIDPFVSAYRSGLTPIPCIACNQHLKFGHLLDRARALGARLATGHYARKVAGPMGPELHRPADLDRDQTYYLHSMDRRTLADLEFPLGHLPKPEVRSLARKLNLPVSDKPDSQEICFVPDHGHAEFVERWDGRGSMPGKLVDGSGKVVGEHRGVHALTVGQRKGLKVVAPSRLYVLQVDAASGQAVVGPEEDLYARGLVAAQATWLVAPEELGSLWTEPVEVQVRARHKPAMAYLVPGPVDGRFSVFFQEPQKSISPGQSAVIYRGTRCLGGGIIEAAQNPIAGGVFHQPSAARVEH